MTFVPSTTAEAIYSLRQYQFIINPSKAFDYLEAQLNTYQLLVLYQHFFPSEWTASQTSLYLPVNEDNSKTVFSENHHSSRELEFITLVYTHLFPMSFWAVESAHEERLQAIPITSMGVDWQMEEGIENLRMGWKLLIPFSKEGRYWLDDVEPEGSEWFDSEFETHQVSYKDIHHPDRIDNKRLRRLCCELTTPLQFLPLALKLLGHETENLWLDESPDEMNYGLYASSLPWSKASINLLHRKWKQASRILDAAYLLIEWLETDMKTHTQLLLQLWTRALKRI
ncbi:hypothetical protein C7B61_00865 [filamentous cyanobacterium CCP1]|nr:hypothetical protein C7B76_00345 [filamentous cyanobacterium CCP2]PSB68438.1 hypothetical protein C7B61_00865 [filamentous cyanobacterium CCP1]